MGRKLMRVPMDFDWPKGKVWHGYLNPHHGTECPYCKGKAHTQIANRFVDEWYGYAPFDPSSTGSTPFVPTSPEIQEFARQNFRDREPSANDLFHEANRLCALFNGMWCHHLSKDDVAALIEAGRIKANSDGSLPSAAEVNVAYLFGIGHDSINRWICVRERCKREGVSEWCAKCNGEGVVWQPDIKRMHDEWTEHEPPSGEGFQLWETTTEGSPASPVFATIEELCEWCAANASVFGSIGASASEWRRMLDEDFVIATDPNIPNAIFI